MPSDWRTGIICPIYKKGDKSICGNYRGITLLDAIYKMFSKILATRLEPWIEGILGDYQAGFGKQRSTMDQIFLIRQVLEKFYE